MIQSSTSLSPIALAPVSGRPCESDKVCAVGRNLQRRVDASVARCEVKGEGGKGGRGKTVQEYLGGEGGGGGGGGYCFRGRVKLFGRERGGWGRGRGGGGTSLDCSEVDVMTSCEQDVTLISPLLLLLLDEVLMMASPMVNRISISTVEFPLLITKTRTPPSKPLLSANKLKLLSSKHMEYTLTRPKFDDDNSGDGDDDDDDDDAKLTRKTFRPTRRFHTKATQ
jgi:hypothetical protein